MKGRPKKYRNGKRVLLFLDEEVVTRLDLFTSNRSDFVNKLISQHLNNIQKGAKSGTII